MAKTRVDIKIFNINDFPHYFWLTIIANSIHLEFNLDPLSQVNFHFPSLGTIQIIIDIFFWPILDPSPLWHLVTVARTLTLAPCDVTFFDRNNKAFWDFWDVLKRKFLPWKMTNYVLKKLNLLSSKNIKIINK